MLGFPNTLTASRLIHGAVRCSLSHAGCSCSSGSRACVGLSGGLRSLRSTCCGINVVRTNCGSFDFRSGIDVPWSLPRPVAVNRRCWRTHLPHPAPSSRGGGRWGPRCQLGARSGADIVFALFGFFPLSHTLRRYGRKENTSTIGKRVAASSSTSNRKVLSRH